jgi:hypothetical protein
VVLDAKRLTGRQPLARRGALSEVSTRLSASQSTSARTKAATGKKAADSILLPLLSAGTGRADVIRSARRQLATAISYLRSRAQFTRVARVYFLAGDETVLAALRVALAELGVIRPKPRGRRKLTGRSTR